MWLLLPALSITTLLFVNSKAAWGFHGLFASQRSTINPAAVSHVSFITLKEEELLDLSHLEFVVFLSSGGPAFQLLVLGTAIYFEQVRLLYCLISDSGADITAVQLCIPGLVIYFSSCKSFRPELYGQFLQTLYQGSLL